MRKKVSLLALLFSVLLFSTFLNVNACVHKLRFSGGRLEIPQAFIDGINACNATYHCMASGGYGQSSPTEVILVIGNGGGGGGYQPPTLQTMTQADFEDLIRRTFAQDGVKIQDLEDDVSQAVLDALNQGKLKIDVRGLS